MSTADPTAPRTPRDGKPYYCTTCGLGFNEWAACEEVDCQLEAEAQARRRMERAYAE